ncbi:MAG: T9SS type A sorting domain-containing protein, partial [Melioribacteraceae bacterium]|nr:T9SS type A sorting domain-containing protein [Melioribacteraceae bacterium]
EDVTKYRVFRAVTNSSTPPSNSQFEWFYECNDNVLFYKDAAIEQNSFGSKYVHYFVESYDESVFKNRTIKRTMDYVEVAWQNCLVLTESNSNPRLVWGPHPTMNPISGNKIYRAVHSNPVNPALRNYQLTASTNNSTFSWIDTDVNLNSTSSYIYYIVKAYYQTTLSTAKNSVGAYGQYNPSKQASEVDENIVLSLSNYPNPFNLTTTIEYSVTVETFIRLEVFNLLGKQVLTLVDKNHQPGTYEVKFDGTNLPSGLYIYKLTANEKIVTKKMMLLR